MPVVHGKSHRDVRGAVAVGQPQGHRVAGQGRRAGQGEGTWLVARLPGNIFLSVPPHRGTSNAGGSDGHRHLSVCPLRYGGGLRAADVHPGNRESESALGPMRGLGGWRHSPRRRQYRVAGPGRSSWEMAHLQQDDAGGEQHEQNNRSMLVVNYATEERAGMF